MIDELLDGREVTIFGRGEQLRDYIYIDDAVDAMLVAAVDPRATGRIYNVGSGAGTPLADFVCAAIDAARSGSYRFAEWPAEFLQVETGDYAADISRITGEIGWSPRMALRDGIAATIAAQRSALGEDDTVTEAGGVIRSASLSRQTAVPVMLAAVVCAATGVVMSERGLPVAPLIAAAVVFVALALDWRRGLVAAAGDPAVRRAACVRGGHAGAGRSAIWPSVAPLYIAFAMAMLRS